MSKINPYMFREYDIRGVYPDDLNFDTAYKVGLAYHKLLPDIKTVVVGQDVRASSDEVKEGIVKALVDVGRTVIDIGKVPVPMVLFAVCHYKYDGGLMITGSHNLKQFTGVKVHKESAYPVFGDDLYKMRDFMINDDLPTATEEGMIEKKDILNDYMDYTLKDIKLARPLKVVIDSGNGVCGYLPEKIFRKLGCEVKTIYGEYDSNFPHHMPDPYHKENMEDLIKEVLKEGADIGIGYDGDGDRTGIIDNKGRMINGGDNLLILARKVLEKNAGSVVIETRTSNAFIEEMEEKNTKVILTVGHHIAILDKLLENSEAVFGGETTGHIYFPKDIYLYDDAIYASLKLIEIVAEQEDFAAYVDSLPRYPATPEIFIDCDDDKKKGLVNDFIGLVKKEGLEYLDIDGAKIIFNNGWGLVRISNTSPTIKTKFEGKTKKDLKEITDKMLPMMAEVGIEFSEKNKEELEQVLNN